MPLPSDSAVIRASLVDPRAFADIFDRHYPRVRGYLGRRVEPEVASELASETFLVAFDRRARYDLDRTGAGPWLLGIATNLLRHHRRSEARRLRAMSRAPRSADATDAVLAIAARADAEAMRRPLFEALAALPDGDRDVLLLFAWADLSYPEIAAALAIPVGTVRSRLHRARARVRERLGSTGQYPSVDIASHEVL